MEAAARSPSGSVGSASPSIAATAGWYAVSSRFVSRPAARWMQSRTSSSRSTASSYPPWGRSASHEAASADTSTVSRRPPCASLTFGWLRYGSLPDSNRRACAESSSSGSRRRAARRHRSRIDDAVSSISSASPATGRTSSHPVAAGRSWSVTASHCARERTAWSRSRPLSHSGYHSRFASSVIWCSSSTCPSWMSTRSRSEHGPICPRDREPVAANPTPRSGTTNDVAAHASSHNARNRSIASAVRARRLPAPSRYTPSASGALSSRNRAFSPSTALISDSSPCGRNTDAEPRPDRPHHISNNHSGSPEPRLINKESPHTIGVRGSTIIIRTKPAVRWRPNRSRRCARASPNQAARPTPCRRRSCRWRRP